LVEGALIRPVGHLLPCLAARAKAIISQNFAFSRQRWEKVADRPDEGSFTKGFNRK
jgi:hypothetical protein